MANRVITVGADPEIFLKDASGKIISAIGVVGGSKRHPRAIGKDCKVQEDNVLAEFNIPPADSVEKFQASIQYTLATLMKEVAEKGLFLDISASHVLDADQLDHPMARVFGCDPDYNAWTRKENASPMAANPDLRSAGGHVHVGIEGHNPLLVIQYVRWSDVTMGLWSVLEDPDLRRRELYGKAGAFRKKPYGFEYRTLSSYWIQSMDLQEKIFNRAKRAVEMAESNNELKDEDGVEIQEAINNSNKALAEKLLVKYGQKSL